MIYIYNMIYIYIYYIHGWLIGKLLEAGIYIYTYIGLHLIHLQLNQRVNSSPGRASSSPGNISELTIKKGDHNRDLMDINGI